MPVMGWCPMPHKLSSPLQQCSASPAPQSGRFCDRENPGIDTVVHSVCLCVCVFMHTQLYIYIWGDAGVMGAATQPARSSLRGAAAASPFAVRAVTTDSPGALTSRRAVNSTALWRGRAGDGLQSPAVENLTVLSTLDWVPAKHLSGTDSACTRPPRHGWRGTGGPRGSPIGPAATQLPACGEPPWDMGGGGCHSWVLLVPRCQPRSHCRLPVPASTMAAPHQPCAACFSHVHSALGAPGCRTPRCGDMGQRSSSPSIISDPDPSHCRHHPAH